MYICQYAIARLVLIIPPPPQSLLCEVTSPKDLPTDELLTVSASLGNTEAVVYRIRITESPDLLVILIPVFAAVLVLCVAVFMVVFAVFCRKTRQKDRRYDQLILELEKLESSVARECKLGEGCEGVRG